MSLALILFVTELLNNSTAEDEAIDREAALVAEMADYYHLGYSQF